MWELIKENERKSWYIFIGMGAFLFLFGFGQRLTFDQFI